MTGVQTCALPIWVKELAEEEAAADLEALVFRSGGTIQLSPLPGDPGVPAGPPEAARETLARRRFSGRIPIDFGVSSVPAIVSVAAGRAGGIHDPAELADHDDLAPEAPEAAPPLLEPPAPPIRDEWDIFAFPRGARAGTCLHEIFEHIDFTRTAGEEITPLIRSTLRKHRFDDRWVPAVAGMVGKVVRLPLDPEAGEGLTLAAVPPSRRINEMEFYFPLKSASGRGLESLFAEHGITGPSGDFPERIGRLEWSRTRGMMKGFIDLVFVHGGRYYLVDWKSNHLGDRPEDYGHNALAGVMAGSFYILQYHLYALALHRYLKHRLVGHDYEAHFGGVRYLFLRGVDPERNPSWGMFPDRPRAGVIRSLEALLVDCP